MTDLATAASPPDGSLLQRWLALRAEEPSLRIRDAADRLGATEAELVAARCGDGVRRLAGPWGDIVKALPDLGEVMVLTRNDHVVHEKTGRFGKVTVMQNMGLVLNDDIDLRLFLGRWKSGFAVTEEVKSGTRHSLQFFDESGTAIHKIYLIDGSDAAAYERIVAAHLDADQTASLVVLPKPAQPADRPDAEIDSAALRARWLALEDVHDFLALLNDLQCGRVQSLRLVGEDLAYRVDLKAFRMALQKAAATELPIMIFVGNHGMIQIHTGPVRQLKEVGPWFNVLDPAFNLHLREDRIAEAWVVRKPTRDGIVTSLEIFDDNAEQIAQMFGKRKPGQRENEDWRALVGSLSGVDALDAV